MFSSPGYGKSTFIQTVVLDLARTHHPGYLHVYLLDFGTNGLLPLKNLPHVADTILVDEIWKGDRPEPIPMVPEEIAYKDFIAWPKTKEMIEMDQIFHSR